MTNKYQIPFKINELELVDRVVYIDFYRFVRAFEASKQKRLDPAVEHALKKLWALGERGAKSQVQDAKEAIQSLQSFINHKAY